MVEIPFFGGGVSFNPTTDIPSLAGKVILVTGGNSGLGKQAILDLVKHSPARIWLAARNAENARNTVAEITSRCPDAAPLIKTLDLDLTSFESIKAAAGRVVAESDRLDILMLNAGIMMAPAGQTKEGYEIQFGTNHVGHAFLTKLLLEPLLLPTASRQEDVRVVVVSSEGHRLPTMTGIPYDKVKTDMKDSYSVTRYGQSKLANVWFAREMARRYPQIKTVSVHPGAVNTNLATPFRESNWFLNTFSAPVMMLMTPVEIGVKNQLWAATGQPKESVVSGEYYVPVGKAGGSALSKDDKLAAELWEWTEKELEGQSI
ncbi:hypothetical protein B0H66DRAFT_569423 [Apodospora peruviana]|uniref:Oxidoreductase n=1 Tax=Apodospora peruviana TaxID=516989 RepID=A0AAE0HUX9_9PEZI|nr:hypothetical protein B0H66DRAFT_569423 [Apodospora peruviana]